MGSADIARTQASYIVGIVTKSSTKLTSQPFCNLRMPNHIRAMLVAMSVGVLREASIIAKDAEKSVTQLPSQLSCRLCLPRQIVVMLVAIHAGILRDLSEAS